jgi:hypothetical protein
VQNFFHPSHGKKPPHSVHLRKPTPRLTRPEPPHLAHLQRCWGGQRSGDDERSVCEVEQGRVAALKSDHSHVRVIRGTRCQIDWHVTEGPEHVELIAMPQKQSQRPATRTAAGCGCACQTRSCRSQTGSSPRLHLRRSAIRRPQASVRTSTRLQGRWPRRSRRCSRRAAALLARRTRYANTVAKSCVDRQTLRPFWQAHLRDLH